MRQDRVCSASVGKTANWIHPVLGEGNVAVRAKMHGWEDAGGNPAGSPLGVQWKPMRNSTGNLQTAGNRQGGAIPFFPCAPCWQSPAAAPTPGLQVAKRTSVHQCRWTVVHWSSPTLEYSSVPAKHLLHDPALGIGPKHRYPGPQGKMPGKYCFLFF
jgi:hypothetical protein